MQFGFGFRSRIQRPGVPNTKLWRKTQNQWVPLKLTPNLLWPEGAVQRQGSDLPLPSQLAWKMSSCSPSNLARLGHSWSHKPRIVGQREIPNLTRAYHQAAQSSSEPVTLWWHDSTWYLHSCCPTPAFLLVQLPLVLVIPFEGRFSWIQMDLDIFKPYQATINHPYLY